MTYELAGLFEGRCIRNAQCLLLKGFQVEMFGVTSQVTKTKKILWYIQLCSPSDSRFPAETCYLGAHKAEFQYLHRESKP